MSEGGQPGVTIVEVTGLLGRYGKQLKELFFIVMLSSYTQAVITGDIQAILLTSDCWK